MSDKLDKKEAAAGLQYIKRFLIPLAAVEWGEDWKQLVQEMLKSIHRIDADVPILGRDMTDLLFYRAIINTPGYKNLVKREILFRIGKWAGQTVVSYYHDLGESKWYRTDEMPDKSIIRRFTESFGWKGKETNPEPPITKVEEAEALQFIRNVAIPYSIDHIYSVFLAFNPRARVEDFPRIGYNDLKNKLKKWQHNNPNNIVYLAEFGKDPRAYFKYYIQKRSGSFGVRVMIHHQLPISNSQKTNDVVLYLDPAKHPNWFKQLGYIKEAHNPQWTDDINREEEIDAERTIVQHILPDAIHWFNQPPTWGGINRRIATNDEVKRGMKKVVRDKDFILYKFQADNDQLWFGISKKIYDNHIISIGYHIGNLSKDDFKTGWIWRQYQPDEGKWDVYLNETLMGPNDKSDITKIEEAQAVQWIRNHIFKYVANQIGTTEQQLRDTFKKMGHSNNIWYTSQSGLPNFPEVIYGIYRDEKNRIIVSVDNEPGWHIDFPVGDRKYLSDFGKIDENGLPSDPMFDINKREESQALQYIRSLIPKVTKELNSYIASQASGVRFNLDRLTSEKSISKNLKKTEHRKQIFSSRRGPQDYIEYSSQEIGRPTVVFYIYKTFRIARDPESGIKIAVGYKNFNPRVSGGGTTSYLTENNGGKYSGESDDAYVTRMVKISPKEEAEGLYYIRRFLFEKASNFWNGMMATGNYRELYVSPEDIAANFKKTERLYIPPDKFMERHAHEKVIYTSLIPEKKYDDRNHIPRVTKFTKKKDVVEGIKFVFYSSKDDNGKLYVGFVPPDRHDPGLCYGIDQLIQDRQKLKESVKKIHRVSKKEELEALQYIRRVLGPYVVYAWNQRTMYHAFESEMVLKQLKKILHKRPPDDIRMSDINTDYILYSVTIPVRDMTLDHKVFFTFAIYKNNEDKIQVKFETPLIDGGPFVVGTSPLSGRSPIRENKNPNPHKVITKIDEYRALDFIKKLIVPLAVKRWNRSYTSHGELSIDKARNSMKKKEHNSWPKIISDFVVYTSDTMIPGLHLHWEIWKDGNGKLMVGWKVDNEENLWATYFVDDPSSVDENIDPLRARLIATYSITKKEEAYAADFIKKKLIPKLVEFINDTDHHYTKHRQITIEEVLKTFKKIDTQDLKDGYKREIQYQALFLGEPFLFDIFKDSNSKLRVLQKSDGTSHFVS